jgi:hypothetical protein
MKKVVWYRTGYEWGAGSRVGPTGVADGTDDKRPLTVTCVKVEARLSPYPGQPKSRHYIRWGSVLERSGVGYVWCRCGSVEPFVRGGLFQSYRVLFKWELKTNLGVETAVACAWEVSTNGPRKSQKRNPAQFMFSVIIIFNRNLIPLSLYVLDWSVNYWAFPVRGASNPIANDSSPLHPTSLRY